MARQEHRVASLDDLPEKVPFVVRVGDQEIGLVRANGKVHAFANHCAHQGGPVCYGEVLGKVEAVLDEQKRVRYERFSETELHLVCPWHGWEYDLETGVNAADPSWQIQKFETIVRGTDVYVVL